MARRRPRKASVTASVKQPTAKSITKSASSRVAHTRAQTAALRAQTPEPLKEPDYDFIKIILVAVISQILYGRGCFPPRNFQSLYVEDLSKYSSLQDIIESGEGMDRLDRSKLLERDTTVMLRQSNDRKLGEFMSTLASALPLIDKKQLLKLRIPITSSKSWTPDCLIEFWTVYFDYQDDGVCCLNIWRGGSDEYEVAEDTTRSCLWQVGTYLTQLPQLSRPFYVTQLFTSQARPEGLGGDWNYSSVEFDDAKLHLVQQQGYCFQKVASLDVLPMNDDISTPSPAGPVISNGAFDRGTKAQRNPSPRQAFADFASTDELYIAEDVDDPPHITATKPMARAVRQIRRGYHLVEPPIETPPSDMEETQEIVPQPSPRRWRKRGPDFMLDDREIPAPGGDQHQSVSGHVQNEVEVAEKPASKRPRRGERRSTGREGSIHHLEELLGRLIDMPGSSNKPDTSKEKARRMLQSHMGQLAKLKSEHMQKETART